jgi:hypothetical protein
VSAKSVDGPGQDFAAVRYHVFLSRLHRYLLPIYEQRIAAFHPRRTSMASSAVWTKKIL